MGGWEGSLSFPAAGWQQWRRAVDQADGNAPRGGRRRVDRIHSSELNGVVDLPDGITGNEPAEFQCQKTMGQVRVSEWSEFRRNAGGDPDRIRPRRRHNIDHVHCI